MHQPGSANENPCHRRDPVSRQRDRDGHAFSAFTCAGWQPRKQGRPRGDAAMMGAGTWPERFVASTSGNAFELLEIARTL